MENYERLKEAMKNCLAGFIEMDTESPIEDAEDAINWAWNEILYEIKKHEPPKLRLVK